MGLEGSQRLQIMERWCQESLGEWQAKSGE